MIPSWQSRKLATMRSAQSDVVRRDQLASVGVTYESIDAQLSAHRWQTLGPVVIVLHNGPLTPVQQLWAAVLNGGKVVALAGRTAAIEAGLTGWDPIGVEIVVPRGTTVEPLAGIDLVVHESRRFTTHDIHPAARPARTRVERSLVDAAAWTKHARVACGLLCSGIQQRITTAEKLEAALVQAGQIRHRRLLAATIRDIAGGAEALSEIDIVRLLRRHRVPVTVERQVVRVDSRGKRRYLDITLRARSGARVHLEIDGAVHLLARRYWDDMLRQNEITILGDRILRFPTIALRLEPLVVVDQICRALGLAVPALAA